MWHTTVWVMVLLTLGGLGIPLAAAQQQPMPRIGVLTSGSLTSDAAWIEAFRQGLRELGYVEGHSIGIEYRYGEGKTERYPALVTELVQRHVAVLVVGGATATRAATQVTTRLPLVMTNVTDPVALGLVASLARPGGNLTGVSNLVPELGGKRLELLKELMPQLAHVGGPWGPQQSQPRPPVARNGEHCPVVRGAGALLGGARAPARLCRRLCRHHQVSCRCPAHAGATPN